MDKRVLLVIVLSLGILLGWNALMQLLYPPPPPGKRPGTPPAVGTVVPPGHSGDPPGPGLGASPAAPASAEVRFPLRTERLEGTVSSRGGASLADLRVWGCAHHKPGDTEVPGDPSPLTSAPDGAPLALAIDVVGAGEQNLATLPWEMSPDHGAWRARQDKGAVSVVAELTPSRDPAHPYHFDLAVTVTGREGSPGTPAVLSLNGPWTPPPSHAPIPEDGVLVAAAGEDPEALTPVAVAEKLAEDPSHELHAERGFRYVGVRADFYLAAILAKEALPPETSVAFRTGRLTVPATPGTPAHTADVAAAVLRIPFALPPAGESRRWEFLVYSGPNSRGVLDVPGSAYEPLADAFPNRAFLFFKFGWISRLLGSLLAFLATTVGLGWGLAVCALTVLVRSLLFPLSRKTQISMRLHAQRMGKLKPKLDAIKAKHKDDQKKQQELTMQLFREEKVSILPSGCWLALVQMPVWISLYGTLQTTFEMRHAGFLWFDDLTAPDHLLQMSFANGWPVIGGWLNLLPILMMATWFGSSMMQPLPEDPEQRVQAKMMRWIPLVFGVFLYQTAAGLTLYMTLSALWSIGESWLIKKVWLSKLGLDKVGAAPTSPM